ncbi:diguanylate cyclase [Desulfococcaceae bacterium HSG8]|nr:diguanylate cyclase [Desulfococcaceae bacterium HSG8]
MKEPVSDAGILIVDDNTGNLRVLSGILKEQGYGIRSLRKPEAVFSSVLKFPPDIILLDIMMPVTDGYEVCEQLKADERTRDIPVIFISALHETDEKVRAFSVGGVDYVTKPFQEEEVLMRVRTHLTLRRIRISLEQEIAERELAEKELRKLYRAVECSASSVVITDSDGAIEFVNPAFCRVTGYSAQEAIGQNPRVLKSGEHPPEFYQEMWAAISGGRDWKGELTNKRKNGDIYWEHVSISPIENSEGRITHYVGIKDDITRLKQTQDALLKANQELERLASADGLTQIANRRRFDEYLQQEWNRQVREQLPLSLILCDIDFFKNYNDTYGHPAGDDCLYRIAQAIDGAARRPADLAARYGGEEFVMVLPNTDAEGATEVAGSIQDAVSRLNIPHAASSVSSCITLSIGVSCTIPMGTGSPDMLINAADQALYEVKKQGRNAILLKK